jgi:hypothetical protein
MQPPLQSRVAIIGVDEFQPAAVSQALGGVAEVFDGAAVQVVQLALGRTAPHECRDGLDQETKLTLAFAKRFFGALAIFDVRVDAVPLDDDTGFVTQRIRTKKEPTIFTIVPTQARFGLSLHPRRHDALPLPGQLLQILWVDGSRPSPRARFFCRKADKIQVVPVQKLGASIWTCRPRKGGNRVDGEFEVGLAARSRLLGARQVVQCRPAKSVRPGCLRPLAPR